MGDDVVRAGTCLGPPRHVVRAALGHPAEHAPAVDVFVHNLCELDRGVKRREGVEGAG